MACDPAQLLEDAKCIQTCIPAGMLPAVSASLLCQLAGGAAGGPYVFKSGDTMTGPLVLPATQNALKLGGTTSAFPALGEAAGVAQFRFADNSNWSSLQAGFIQANQADASGNTTPVAAELYHETTGGAGGGAATDGVAMDFRADSATVDRQLQVRLTSLWNVATDATRTSELRFLPVLNGTTTEAMRINNVLVDARGGTFFGVAGVQVVSARNTGWATFGAGASNKNAAALDTATVTTAQLAQIVKALMDALIAHGLIGA